MKNLINRIVKLVVAGSLSVVLFVSAVVPAHAIDPGTALGVASLVLQLISMHRDNPSRTAADLDKVWRSSYSSSRAVQVSAEDLWAAQASLNGSGVTCRVVSLSMFGGTVYVIRGVGFVDVDYVVYSLIGVQATAYDYQIDGKYLTNPDGYLLYCITQPSSITLNQIRQYVDGVEGYIDGVEGYLNSINNIVSYWDSTEHLATLMHTIFNGYFTDDRSQMYFSSSLTTVYDKVCDIVDDVSDMLSTLLDTNTLLLSIYEKLDDLSIGEITTTVDINDLEVDLDDYLMTDVPIRTGAGTQLFPRSVAWLSYQTWQAVEQVNSAVTDVDGYLYYTLTPALTSLTGSLQNNGATLVSHATATDTSLQTIIELLQDNLSNDTQAHEHIYTRHITQDATCTVPGLATYTCDECGYGYTELLPALGHDWEYAEHVNAVLDENDEVVQPAYDIYTCTRCNHSYQDHDGTGAPVGSDQIGDLITSIFSRLGNLAGSAINGLLSAGDSFLTGLDDLATDFNDKVHQVEGFGGDYPAWLAGFYEALPADLQLALSFCLILSLIGICGKRLVFAS